MNEVLLTIKQKQQDLIKILKSQHIPCELTKEGDIIMVGNSIAITICVEYSPILKSVLEAVSLSITTRTSKKPQVIGFFDSDLINKIKSLL